MLAPMGRALGMLALGALALGCSRELQVLTPQDAAAPGTDASIDAGLDAGPPLLGQSDISSSSTHVCRLDRGAMFCWGANGSGQLGDETRNASNVPLQVGQRTDWAQVEPGDGFTCGRSVDGEVWCWGENAAGQLGQGDVVDRLEATQVPGGPWSFLSAGQSHVCALDEAAALWCWGRNFEGQLGQDDAANSDDIPSPVQVTPGMRYRDVSGGDGHTCALDESGGLWCWGRNTQAQLGIGAGAPIQTRVPQRVGAASYADVEATQHHTCALRDDGALVCWGEDTHGEIGQGLAVGTGMQFPDPVQVGTRTDWVALDVHWFSTCVIASDGAAHCAGRGIEGQLGRGSTMPSGDLVPAMHGGAFSRVALGRFHVCAQQADDAAFCWGANSDGQLGTGDNDRRNVPTSTR